MKLLLGDCLEQMKSLEDNSVDACVTDPPYGLSFMGKKWDYDVPKKEIWEQVLRVLKPGGYLLSFAGTRTQHRMAVNIEDAGFEIRDMIAWVYGSGFPKSLNIGKAVDKLQGNEREVIGKKHNTYDGSVRNPDNHKSPAELSNIGKWGLSKTPHGMNETKGTSEWEGWGTALKPALEPITVARKPLSEKSVAENCLKWGVGGINIDGCRVEYNGKEDFENTLKSNTGNIAGGTFKCSSKSMAKEEVITSLGRFPANFIHDGSEEVTELFPNTKSNGEYKKIGDWKNTGNGKIRSWDIEYDKLNKYAGDSGSASRFFYCAKASKSERNRGCEEMELKPAFDNANGNMGGNMGSRSGPRQNNHPTVKPIALMEYLIKLVSKEGHTILDPFMGSGSTGIACRNLNREFIGIELEPDYMKIAEARIYNTIKHLQEELWI